MSNGNDCNQQSSALLNHSRLQLIQQSRLHNQTIFSNQLAVSSQPGLAQYNLPGVCNQPLVTIRQFQPGMLGIGNHLQAADQLAIQPGVPSHVRLPSQLEVAVQREVINCPVVDSNQLQATGQLGAAIVNQPAAILHPSQSGVANQPQVTNWPAAAANPNCQQLIS